MRTIKFRGKSEVFNEWLIGNLVVADNGTYCICKPQEMEMDGHHIRQFADRPLYVNPETIGQFTGEIDDNEKEIYEGDIIRFSFLDHDSDTGWHGTIKTINVVRFEYAEFRIDTYPYRINHCWDMTDAQVEVIGNIYDNPELLRAL